MRSMGGLVVIARAYRELGFWMLFLRRWSWDGNWLLVESGWRVVDSGLSLLEIGEAVMVVSVVKEKVSYSCVLREEGEVVGWKRIGLMLKWLDVGLD